MKFENTEVFNFEGALRGMRNPMNSWDKSDSFYCEYEEKHSCCEECRLDTKCNPSNHNYIIGEKKDLKLARKLIKAGSEHRKFMRQIFVSVDITAPLYWWKEFDTYKVGTVANSTSIMHKLSETPITVDCFEIDDCNWTLETYTKNGGDYEEIWSVEDFFEMLIFHLESLRLKYIETKNKNYWKELIRWLPGSWLQKRTVTMSYENILIICNQRKNHKLNEWSGQDDNTKSNFISWARSLPYAQELIFIDEIKKGEQK